MILSVAAPAHAAVSIAPQQVVVSTSGASAVIDRSPFRISYRDGNGRTVLSEAANSAQPPNMIAPIPYALPGGSHAATSPTLYAPLTFTVGVDRSVQYPGTTWEGDQLAGTQAGIQYSARAVLAAVPAGSGVTLTVSTDDPSGRQLLVTVVPGRGAEIHVHTQPSNAAGVATVADSFASDPGEAFHGFGGRHNAIDEHGQDFYNWIEQENFGAGQLSPATAPAPGTGGETYLFPNGPTAAYYVQAMFVSSRPYGFRLDNTDLSRFRLDSDRPDAWQAAVGAASLDYTVAPGAASTAIATLTASSGRHRVPPAWGAGPQMDRLVKFPNETAADYRAAVESDLRHIAAGDIKLSAYRIEGWQYFDEATLRRYIARLHALGVKALVYFRAFVDNSNGGTDRASAYQEATSRGYVATTAAGKPYLFLGNYNNAAALIDFTNPAAVAWWDGRLHDALDAGADGFMEDFGEQTLVDMHFHDGETGASMHNRYPTIYHAATRRFLDSYEAAHPGRRLFVYVRSGYNGSAAAEQANFPGDETTDWGRSSGIASLTKDMLNRAVGGAYGYDTDIGGYFDIGPYQSTTKELLLRWAEWAALSPTFRLHGSISAGTHAPWTFDPQTVALYRQITALHERATPLILRLWREAAATGMPITRPLWLAYPHDPTGSKQDQEWLLGPDVLVAPVVSRGATARRVYFPAGCWQSPDSGARHAGPGYATVVAPVETLPYFFRCGTHPFEPPARLRCVDRRRFKFRIRHARIVRVVVYLDGRKIRTIRGHDIRRFSIARLPVGRYTVRIVTYDAHGKRNVTVRRYVGCRKTRPRTLVRRRHRH